MRCIEAPSTTPRGTHAYIISAEMAERMARAADWMLKRAQQGNGDRSAWELDADDVNSDHFIRNYYDYLTPSYERHR